MSESPEQLYARWTARDAVAVGRDLFAPLTPAQRVERGAAVLGICLAQIPAPPAVAHVLTLATERERWSEAHEAFSAVRYLTLAEERHPTSAAYSALLFVAENVAKTVYNASGAPAPFDEDSPWWIASCARSLVETLGDPHFEHLIWTALVGTRL
jgi:hypothetical protein